MPDYDALLNHLKEHMKDLESAVEDDEVEVVITQLMDFASCAAVEARDLADDHFGLNTPTKDPE